VPLGIHFFGRIGIVLWPTDPCPPLNPNVICLFVFFIPCSLFFFFSLAFGTVRCFPGVVLVSQCLPCSYLLCLHMNSTVLSFCQHPPQPNLEKFPFSVIFSLSNLPARKNSWLTSQIFGATSRCLFEERFNFFGFESKVLVFFL